MPDIEIVDRFGRRRRARRGEIPRDGETIHFPVSFMDAATREVHDALAERFGSAAGDQQMKVTDGFGNPGGFRPGYVFASNSDLADEATKAYEERNQRLSSSWRTKGDHNEQQSDNTRDAAPRTRRSLGEAQKLVDDAYAQKVARLDYRHRRHAT